jgi:hypothetical protein
MQNAQNSQHILDSQNAQAIRLKEIQKIDDTIQSRVIAMKTSGFTQPKFLALLLIILSLLILFQSVLQSIPLLYYILFIAYLIALIICIIYF